MSKFIFKSYTFDEVSLVAQFTYEFKNGQSFTEIVRFCAGPAYDNTLLRKALFLAFILIGTSYYKTFPTRDVVVLEPLDEWQATFFSRVYQEGLSQLAYENNLSREDLAQFGATTKTPAEPRRYGGSGILALQSGGKDSLLLAALLQEKKMDFTAWYMSSGEHYPVVLESVGSQLVTSTRTIDLGQLKSAHDSGAMNGHVPVTYIVQSIAIIQAILLGKRDILTSIAHEGEEPHHAIGDLSVTHQWSKTWAAEQAFSEYVSRYISPDIRIGSPLRNLSELRVAELFIKHAWKQYGHTFSSCNIANYQQGANNTSLTWCGNCPKCANSYLLFTPYLATAELTELFEGRDLFMQPNLTLTFKGLLGVEGITKPFECIGEVDELRLAYHKAQARGHSALPFTVPESSFDDTKTYEAQDWAIRMIQ